VETYFKCPICQHSMRYSNVWKHQKFACWSQQQNQTQLSPQLPLSLPNPVSSPFYNSNIEGNGTVLITNNNAQIQEQIYPFAKKRKESPTEGDPTVFEDFNSRISTIDQLSNPLYGDYLYDLLEKEIVEPITGNPSKFYMNRILSKTPQDLQEWVEEVFAKKPAVLENIRTKIMRELQIITEKNGQVPETNTNTTL